MADAEAAHQRVIGVADGHLRQLTLRPVGLLDFAGSRDGYLLEVETDRDGHLRMTVEADQLAAIQAAVAGRARD